MELHYLHWWSLLVKTKDRVVAKLPIGKIGTDTIKGEDPVTKLIKNYTLTKERVLTDDDGNIIGVEKTWQ